jgi:hypothetical protein
MFLCVSSCFARLRPYRQIHMLQNCPHQLFRDLPKSSKIGDFHGGDYEECRLLGSGAV